MFFLRQKKNVIEKRKVTDKKISRNKAVVKKSTRSKK
jgi:hypothetical protein